MASSKTSTTTPSIKTPSSTGSQQLRDVRIVQNFYIVWLDQKINENDEDYRNSIAKLREVVNTVNPFVDLDECIDFITGTEEKVFMVISGKFDKNIISIVHDISQVNRIYILHKRNLEYEKWAKQWPKVANIYTSITHIYEALKHATKDCDRNAVSIAFAETTDEASLNLDRDTLHFSFMYTQILKEILLTIDFEQEHVKEFFTYCRKQFVGNYAELKHVDIIEQEYRRHQPIWWYTRPCFLYSMLNKALRLMEADLITTMGFFVRDLHENIITLYSEQYNVHHNAKSFIVYRGQGLSKTDFDHLQTLQSRLISFNNFLSTSLDRAVSLAFAESCTSDSHLIGVLFEIYINPSIPSSSFANIKNVSYFKEEEEILFSMHTVFRIEQVKPIEKNNNRLWQVNLTLTSDRDPQLREVTKTMREETNGPTGWFRLARLMMKIAQFDMAEQVFKMVLDRTIDKIERLTIYSFLGSIKTSKGEFTEALEYFNKSLIIKQKTLPANHPDFATSYNEIGLVYSDMGEYSKALSFGEKALKIQQKVLPANHPDLTASYVNIGCLYVRMIEYSKALSCYEKALEAQQKTLPANHPDLASAYGNIGSVYSEIGDYSKALSFHEKALEIHEKSLPENHPHLTTSYNNIGGLYMSIGEFSKALLSLEKAFDIHQKAFPGNNFLLAGYYNNIGFLYDKMDKYAEAVSYYEKAIESYQKSFAKNHPYLGRSYSNIGNTYRQMGEYSKALSSLEKALEIREKMLPADHPDFADSYNNIGVLCLEIGDYAKAFVSFEKAVDICEKAFSTDHPLLSTSYSNMGAAYCYMGELSKALSFVEKALEIDQKTLPENNPDLARSYNDVGVLYMSMGEYSKALSYYERALNIFQRSLLPNHPGLHAAKQGIEMVKLLRGYQK